ncbi:MAG: nitrogenase molybdenum-iron protein subunit beta [Capsulimonadaceae bacterium]|nr:nitrogenase molybdenum-iron protein subunit beta [Capsulimonadaceae bacterium]
MLDITPKEIKPRTALRINPAKTCQPIGAMYAALGIHGCLPHSHGSQGCCSYHRMHLTRHFKEPVMASTSSFTEGSSVFGGLANLSQAINTIFTVYNPEVIAVHTTCLSEVIGDDIPNIIAKAVSEGTVPEGKFVFHANTPSFAGSHMTGFSSMVRAMVHYFSEKTGAESGQVNIIPGFVNPADMREIKRIASEMGVPALLFPDTSDVLDTPLTGKYDFYPPGGVTIKQLRTTGDSLRTLALGPFASEAAGAYLDEKCDVPCDILDLPIGIAATDRFVHALKNVAAQDVPASINYDRGRLIDVMNDMHRYTHGLKVAVFGDPDHVTSMVEFLLDLNMKPVHVVTGTPGNRFERRMTEILEGRLPDSNFSANADLFLLHQWIKNEPVDLLIGNTYGKYIARAEDLPFVRFGFPTLDRIGHQFKPHVGYTGALHLLESILNAIMDRQDRDATDETLELVM